MNLRDLQYFVTLARTGHMGEAALQCHVSQPTMSIQLRKLEESLGVALFEREGRSIRLSRDGEALVPHALAVLQATEALKGHAASLSDPESGILHMGAFPTLAPYYFPHALPRLAARFPRLQFRLHEEKSSVLIEQLLQGFIDAAWLALPVQERGLVAYSVGSEPFYVGLSVHHPLAKHKHITASQLVREQILLLDEGHCLRDQALEVCAHVGAAEMDGFRATSLETLCQMVALGNGVTLVPACAAVRRVGLVYRALARTPFSREIALVTRASSSKRGLVQSMATLLAQHPMPTA